MRWGTDKKIIKALRERLRWYMYEAGQDEFDNEEVNAIIDLLQVIDPIERREGDFYTASKALDRFWTFFAFRERPDEEESPYPLTMRIQMKLRHIIRSTAFANVTFIIALVVAMFLGGTAVTFAQKEGFFHWMQKDTDTNISIASPQTVDTEDTVNSYMSFEQVPLNYIRFIWAPTSMDVLQDFSLCSINIYDNKAYILSECLFKKDEAFIKFSRKEYNGDITGKNLTFDMFELLDSEEINGTIVDTYRKVNDDYTEYIACFYIKSSIYTVNSNVEIEDIKKIIASSSF